MAELAVPELTVDARDVVKHYGAAKALDGVSLDVRAGEILGLIGPNGAGKTTLVECLAGLRRRDRGTMLVMGRDPARADAAFYRDVAIQPQTAALIPGLRVGEVLRLFASLYEAPRPVGDLVAALGLAGLQRRKVSKLSGGQRQRVLIGTALVGRPRLVFLDEVSTGLDPQTRIAMWEVIERMREAGTTVVLTTHYMEEAEHLADRVAVIDSGRVLACGPVKDLVKAHAPGVRISFADDPALDLEALRGLPEVASLARHGGQVRIEATGDGAAPEVFAAVARQGIAPRDVSVVGGGLEDVFLALTGRAPHPDGAASHPDGAASHPDGAASHPDGATPHPDGQPRAADADERTGRRKHGRAGRRKKRKEA